VDMFLHHARLLSDRGDFDAALCSLIQADALEPGSGQILAALAQAHAKLGAPEDALRHARAAVAAEPRHAGYRAQLAGILADAGDLTEAEPQIRQAMDLLPRFGRFNMDLALILEKAGRTEEAIEQAIEGVRIWPDVGALRVMCADLLIRNGRLEEAARQQARAIDLGVKHAGAHWRLATFLGKLGDQAGAIQAAEAAVTAAPQDQALREYLAALRKRSEPAS
jgi:tetratricopeptide (TPR) repeat protein